MAGSMRCAWRNATEGSPDATNRLYRNKRDGTLKRLPNEQYGVLPVLECCAGDYDNDGWIDLFVTVRPERALSKS